MLTGVNQATVAPPTVYYIILKNMYMYSGKNLSSLLSANKLKYPLVLKMKELNIPLSLSVIFSPIT